MNRPGIAFTVLAAVAAALPATRAEPDLKDTRVHIPWEDFRQIVERLVKPVRRPARDTATAPVDYVISSCRIQGAVQNNAAARLTAKVSLQVLPSPAFAASRWVAVPLGAVGYGGNAAVLEQVLVDGKSAALNTAGGQYRVLLARTGRYDLTLQYHCPVQGQEGSFGFTLNPPRAAAVSLDLAIPGQRAEVSVNGEKQECSYERGGTRLSVPVAGDRQVGVSYTLTAGGEAGEGGAAQMTPKVFASTGMLVGIKENRVTYQLRVQYEIWRVKRKEFAIALPDSLPVENIQAPGLVRWDSKRSESGQTLRVQSSYAPEREYSLTVEFSRKLESAEAMVTVPSVRVLDVDRQSGYLAVQASPTMEVFTGDSVSQVSAVSPSDLPSWLHSQPDIILRYKYSRVPFRLDLSVMRHQDMPVLVAVADEALYTVLQTRDGNRLAKFRYYLRNNQKQYLRVSMAGGWELWSVLIDGRAVMPASGDSAGVVLIPLKKSAAGQESEGFTLELVYWLESKRMGRSGKLQMRMPVIDVNCQKTNGEIYVPQEYRLGPFKAGFDATGYFSSERLASAQTVTNAEVDYSRDYNMPVQSNTFTVRRKSGTKGKVVALPVEIEVPQDGICRRFTRGLTVAGEQVTLACTYRRGLDWLRDALAIAIWVIVFGVAFGVTAEVVRRFRKERVRGPLIGGAVAVVLLMILNTLAGLGAPSLMAAAVLAVGCAVVAKLAFSSRKEVAA